MDVKKFMRCKKLYKFFTSNRRNLMQYANLKKKIIQLYGETNFEKVKFLNKLLIIYNYK
jgi:hypothetical protein